MTNEGRVKAQVDEVLKSFGADVWYFKPVSNGLGKHGIPDYIVCVAGRFLAVECKGDDRLEPTRLQQLQMDGIRCSQGRVLLVTPATVGALRVEIHSILGRQV